MILLFFELFYKFIRNAKRAIHSEVLSFPFLEGSEELLVIP